MKGPAKGIHGACRPDFVFATARNVQTKRVAAPALDPFSQPLVAVIFRGFPAQVN
jgi:hypothetical protein